MSGRRFNQDLDNHITGEPLDDDDFADDARTPVTRDEVRAELVRVIYRAGILHGTGTSTAMKVSALPEVFADAILAEFTVLHPVPVTVPPPEPVKLDPWPFASIGGARHTTGSARNFDPRPGYSQNPADYSPKGTK